MSDTPPRSNDAYDEFLGGLQEYMDAKAVEFYGKTFYAHWKQPRHYGDLPEPHARGEVRDAECRLRITLHIHAGRIQRAGFSTDGCSTTIAASEAVCRLALGRSLAEARGLTTRDILTALGGLPPDKQDSAELARQGLQAALAAVECPPA